MMRDRWNQGTVRRRDQEEGQRKFSGPAVLIVDDDADMRAYLRRCLRPISGKVVEARDGAEALSIVREAGPGAFDLIVTDVVMPVLDGLALRRALAEDPGLGAPAVLLITGESPGPQAGAVLRKPFNSGTLRKRVEQLLSERRAASKE